MLLDVYSYIMDVCMVTIYPTKAPILVHKKGCMVTMVLTTNKENYGSIDFTGLGKNITEIREKRGLTQEELAEKIGVSRKTISNWENAIKKPRLQDLLKLCDALSCDLDYLLGKSTYSTKKIASICEYTGLSENTVDMFHSAMGYLGNHYLGEMISEFFDNYQEFPELLMQISTYYATRESIETREKALQKIPWKERDYSQVEELTEVRKSVDGELFACITRIQEMYDAAKYSPID